jgi:ABC-type glycerol-3-phosphate transport system substrate-binding protein
MSKRSISRRQFLSGTLAFAGSLALAACAAPAAPTSGGAAEPAAAGGAAPSQEPIELVFHSRLGSHADWHKSRVPLFEEQHPGLKLTIRKSMPWLRPAQSVMWSGPI